MGTNAPCVFSREYTLEYPGTKHGWFGLTRVGTGAPPENVPYRKVADTARLSRLAKGQSREREGGTASGPQFISNILNDIFEVGWVCSLR